MNMHSVCIVDCTLREGNQAPNVKFSVSDSLTIARQLDRVGVDFIEVGHPYASEEEFSRVASIAKNQPKAFVLAHARACAVDIEAVAKTGASWVGIFAGVNKASQDYRIRKGKDAILELIAKSVDLAKERGLFVRYTVEDSSRTSMQDLIQAYDVALSHGADRICFADSVGIYDPVKCEQAISELRGRFPMVPIEVHFHDDRGLALANSLAALSAGATHISCSVNGLGERAGITDTCSAIANLAYIKSRADYLLAELVPLSRLVAETTKIQPDAQRPVVGKNCFTHTSKLHVIASSRYEDCYHWMSPKELGRSSIFSSLDASLDANVDREGC
ncbi:LeuA family protein [Pseudomonas sp. EpS/L25]|uniref:LeuA family protein n=1 Tax=Pseudomonas sp. EpS/L25 TaxID=1749078 RepID=UPI0009EC99A6|nr:hypothetical protein [Pseudomonas sp. EpS/L25]